MSRLPLLPGDVILTWREPGGGFKEFWNRYFHRELMRLSRKRYPGALDNELKADHVRLCVESDADRCIGFEFTGPAARHFYVTQEMLKWPGLRVYRPRFSLNKLQHSIMDASMRYDGTLYDLGELIAFRWPWLHKLDFGSRNRVCSTGARLLLSHSLWRDVLPGIPERKTLPCDFAMHADFFRINHLEE